MSKYNAQILHPSVNDSVREMDPACGWSQSVLSGVGIAEQPSELHTDMHAYLRSCGVDGVKVDVQSMVGFVGSATVGGPALSAAWQRSLEQSVRTHFAGNHCINCMSHSTENLYR